MTHLVQPPIALGFIFDGVDDQVDVPDDPSLDLTDGITIGVWVYPKASVDWMGIVVKGNDGAENYELLLGDQKLAWAILWTDGTRNSEAPSLSYKLNEWMHLVIIYEPGQNVRWYKNGQFVDLGLLPSKTPQTNDVYLGIGREPGTLRFLNGILGEICIFNRILTDAEIGDLCSIRRNIMDGCVLKLGTVGLVRGGGTQWLDESPCKNHGTVYGAKRVRCCHCNPVVDYGS